MGKKSFITLTSIIATLIMGEFSAHAATSSDLDYLYVNPKNQTAVLIQLDSTGNKGIWYQATQEPAINAQDMMPTVSEKLRKYPIIETGLNNKTGTLTMDVFLDNYGDHEIVQLTPISRTEVNAIIINKNGSESSLILKQSSLANYNKVVSNFKKDNSKNDNTSAKKYNISAELGNYNQDFSQLEMDYKALADAVTYTPTMMNNMQQQLTSLEQNDDFTDYYNIMQEFKGGGILTGTNSYGESIYKNVIGIKGMPGAIETLQFDVGQLKKDYSQLQNAEKEFPAYKVKVTHILSANSLKSVNSEIQKAQSLYNEYSSPAKTIYNEATNVENGLPATAQ